MPLDQGIAIKQFRKGAPFDVVNENSPNAIKKRDEKSKWFHLI
jgi:hypothetical protein